MIADDNPFLACDALAAGTTPYDKNPFSILESETNTTQARLERRAEALEGRLARRGTDDPPDAVPLDPGDGRLAAQLLARPALRITFELMHDHSLADPYDERDS